MSELIENFNYWAEEHFIKKTVKGTYSHCINEYKRECVDFPRKSFSTHVWHKESDNKGNYMFIIRRFKTEELFQIHVSYPPTYVRTGVSL
jgi:intein-encoded DNA endonuclease-like protein